MTFVSNDRGFALGTIPCAGRPCTTVLTSVDGAQTWQRVASSVPFSLQAEVGECDACVRQIRFADPEHGYAYGPALWTTSDGGRTWRRDPSSLVSALEAGRVVVRMAVARDGCDDDDPRLQTAPVGTARWRDVSFARPRICQPGVIRQGQRLVLVSHGNSAGSIATGSLAVSNDLGAHWRDVGDPCSGGDSEASHYLNAVAVAPPQMLATTCDDRGSDLHRPARPRGLAVSRDNGASVDAEQPIPDCANDLAAASATTFLMLCGRTQVLASFDAGRRWTPTLTFVPVPAADVDPLLVGYQDPLHARVALGNLVWSTVDGGRTWAGYPFLAG